MWQSSTTATPGTDADLVQECLRGNEHAWSAVVRKYEPLVYSAPVRYRMRPQDAADILQDVWVDLHSGLKGLRSSELAGWLASVASHKCFHWKRRRQRRPEHQVLPELEPPAREPLAPERLETAQQAQLVRDTVSELPERDRRLVQMLFFEDPPAPYAEVARELGLAEGSIGFMRANCLRKLRDALERRGFAAESPACGECRVIRCAPATCEKRSAPPRALATLSSRPN
jgi:RNA polymerase sigma factor (sigma-70 family)